jgi:simple sugar transport system permease protein
VSTAVAHVSIRRISVNRARGLGILYILLAVTMAVAFGAGAAPGIHAQFGLNEVGSKAVATHIPNLTVPVRMVAFVLAAVCAALGVQQLTRGFGERSHGVLALAVALFLFSFLAWGARGQSLNLVGMLQGTLLRATPLTLGALSGILCERSGVINIGIEGEFLMSAMTGAMVASAVGSLWAGIVAGVLMGGLMGGLLALLSIRYRVDQIIAGVVLNIFAMGFTGFLTDRVLQPYQSRWNSPGIFSAVHIPLLSKIPVLGPIVFDSNVFVYLMLILVVVVSVALFRTRWGLRVRAVGEHPQAADTVGIKVLGIRYRNVILGGMAAGLGGAYFTLGSTGQFSKGMTSGLGFIALAAMIFGGWKPYGALMAALIFGLADAVQYSLAILNVPIPSEFLLMAPYLVTILVVAGVVGRVRPPAADGKPYIKE